jgi:hypothetical protein
MLEYVLVLYINDQPNYIGNFETCAHANNYIHECYLKSVMPTDYYVSCQHQDYLFLPEGFVANYPEGCSKD